jgi:hypothetical protein
MSLPVVTITGSDLSERRFWDVAKWVAKLGPAMKSDEQQWTVL